MYAQDLSFIHRTGKPVAAGIINIVIGSICVLSALCIGFGMLTFLPSYIDLFDMPTYLSTHLCDFVSYFAWKFGVLGILSIIGGVFNLRRRIWGLALAGSIAATLLTLGGAVVSVILTTVSRDEFAQ